MDYRILVLALSLAICVPFVFLRRRIQTSTADKLLKALAIVVFLVAMGRCFMNDNFIWVINGGVYGEHYYKVSDVLQSILRWFMFASYTIYICAVFFENRTMRNFAIYACLPMNLVSVFFYDDFMAYFLQDSGRAFYIAAPWRHAIFCFELVLLIILPVLLMIFKGHYFAVKDKKEWFAFFGLLPLAMLACMPVTLPQSLFGFTTLFMTHFSLQHFAWIALIFGTYAIMHFALRYKSKEVRTMVCYFVSIYLFLHYNSIYLMDLNLSRLPFQLCNLASYMVLIALIIRKKPFFDFILMANVPGTLIAICLPDINSGMLSYWNIHFYLEHSWVFIVPLLMVSLRIMDRPSKHMFRHFLIGFCIYFVFCATAGILINAYLYVPNHPILNKVNYFYLFNDTVLEAAPFLGFTRKIPLTINGYTCYPVYMGLIFLGYIAICFACYYVYTKLIKIGDDHANLRKIRIGLLKEKGFYKKHTPPTEYVD